MSQPLSSGTAAVVTGRDVFVPSFREMRVSSVGHFLSHVMTDELGISIKVPLMLPLPVLCISLLIPL